MEKKRRKRKRLNSGLIHSNGGFSDGYFIYCRTLESFFFKSFYWPECKTSRKLCASGVTRPADLVFQQALVFLGPLKKIFFFNKEGRMSIG